MDSPDEKAFSFPLQIRASTALLCGYYGENNLGDDLLLDLLLRSLPKKISPTITINNKPNRLTSTENVSLVRRRNIFEVMLTLSKVDLLILGGGTLLQDITSFRSLVYYLFIIKFAVINKIPVILWAQGFGPFKSKISSFLVRYILKDVQLITWRDNDSLQTANQLGIDIPMFSAPDPLWQYPIIPWNGGGPITICWSRSRFSNNKNNSKLLYALELLSDELRVPILWLAFHKEQDSIFFEELYKSNLMNARLKSRIIFEKAIDYNLVKQTFSESSLVIPMRLHAFILSVLGQCPTSPLSHDPKLTSAARYVNIPCMNLNNLPSAEEIFTLWQESILNRTNPFQISKIRKDSFLHSGILENIR